MSEFHEARLPARLAFGCTGGIERRTEVVSLASGHERRTSPWSQSRRRYLIATAPRPLDADGKFIGPALSSSSPGRCRPMCIAIAN